MLKKIRTEEPQEDNSSTELDALQHTDWVKGVLIRAVVDIVVSITHICLVMSSCIIQCNDGDRVCVYVGSSVGAADEGVEAGRKAQEGGGAAL